jgi:hypothetical protein
MAIATLARAGRLADQVRAEARQLDPVRVLFTLLMVVPFVAGWLAAQICKALWAVVAFVWTATVVGWRMARGEGDEPQGQR